VSVSLILMYKGVKIKVYENIILFVVLCGCECWFLILRGEHIGGGIWGQNNESNT
jgi:hypothetical protein